MSPPSFKTYCGYPDDKRPACLEVVCSYGFNLFVPRRIDAHQGAVGKRRCQVCEKNEKAGEREMFGAADGKIKHRLTVSQHIPPLTASFHRLFAPFTAESMLPLKASSTSAFFPFRACRFTPKKDKKKGSKQQGAAVDKREVDTSLSALLLGSLVLLTEALQLSSDHAAFNFSKLL
ncbi:unnamed protein product [Pleuronectes platessa]|uniref:Uncharacterized protein n=1 Tax=Pleuronectes platessa TaxID=8262 RepID=A0A9N7U589_PLEPL|nr:unnamed protein product [Pleuronectes platessa]